MKVWNRKMTLYISSGAVLIDITTKWGNPFKIGKDSNRAEVISKYRHYAALKLLEDPHWLDELRGKDLVCWCAPLPCHGDVLLELANK